MTFWKTIFAKTFNLTKTSSGKFPVITFCSHPFDHFFLKRMNGSNPAKGRHSPAQLISFAGRKPCADNSNFHCLFLK